MGISSPCYFRMKAHWYKEELVSVEIYFITTWEGFHFGSWRRDTLFALPQRVLWKSNLQACFIHCSEGFRRTCSEILHLAQTAFSSQGTGKMRPLMNWVFWNPFLTNVLVRQLKVPIRLSAVWKNNASDALQHMVLAGVIDTTPNCLIETHQTERCPVFYFDFSEGTSASFALECI